MNEHILTQSDLISRQAAIDAVEQLRNDCGGFGEELDRLSSDIDSLPSADRPKGEWKVCKSSIGPWGNDVKCSVCGHQMGSSFGYKFCPMCGADMRGTE